MKLKERLDFESSNMFFFCPTDNARYIFDEAIETSFQCPVCGGKLDSIQNVEIIATLKRKISEIERNLAE
jgi:transcription initiation factor TFIIE subunit alpha